MAFLFWFSVALILYAYIGYPIALWALALFSKNTVMRDEQYCPHVSLIITVHNEQERIQDKIQNTLALDYPEEKLEVIFASDASTDQTEDIIKTKTQFKVIRSPERKGKEFAQKCAVEQATGEILIFSDVATMIEPEGLRTITANFADPTVGCVSSEDRFIDEQGRVSGEGAYVKYEMFLRKLESKIFSVVGLSGSFFAARRIVCANWAVDLQSDFNTLLNSLKLGLRGISDPHTLGWYRNIADEKKEFNRKVRTVVRGISVLMRNFGVLNPFQYGLFSWKLFSHKLCRWLVPFFLFFALITNIFLVRISCFYLFSLMMQIIFYALAAINFIADIEFLPFYAQKTKKFISVLAGVKSLKIPYYFVIVNAAILIAWIKFIKGERSVYWEPSKR